MDKDEKDELGAGYSLDDFGLNFDENAGNLTQDSASPISTLDLESLCKSHKDSRTDLHKSHSVDESSTQNSESYDCAPQFKGFDFSEATYEVSADFSTDTNTNAPQDIANFAVTQSEKEMLLTPIQARLDKKSEIFSLFVAYLILFAILLLFMPQVYLANNIYYASKNINYLKSQREALRDENGDLQQKLESLKFNFLTLEIEEIK